MSSTLHIANRRDPYRNPIPKQTVQGDAGFALVISLSLMALMVLVLIVLGALVQTEVSTATRSKIQVLARQNAYMGMVTALGELQKFAGPDARATARSDIFEGPDGLSSSVLKNPYWLGVWNAQNEDGTVKDAGDYKAWNALDSIEKIEASNWIVSGNAGLDQSDPDYWTPLSDVPEDDTTVVLANEAPAYDVPEVRVPKVALSDGTADAGHFGYWVSGENSKALVNLYDADSIGTSDEDILNRSFQIANRTGVNLVSGLEDYDPEADSIEKVVSLRPGLLEWMPDDSIDAAELARARVHDLTTVSKGLLVDVKDGALKRDLTQAFEIENSFEETFSAHYNTYVPEMAAVFPNQLASDEAAADPMTPEPFYFIEDEIMRNSDGSSKAGGPNWGILKSYYQHYWPASNLNDNYARLGATRTDPDRGTFRIFSSPRAGAVRHADPRKSGGLPYQYWSSNSHNDGDNYQTTSFMTPVVSQIFISYALELLEPDGGGPKVPVLTFRPVISMLNPYNIRLGTTDYGLSSTLNPKITMVLDLPGGKQTVEFYHRELNDGNKQGSLKLRMDQKTIPPGAVLHNAFNGSPFGAEESSGGTDYLKAIWDQVGGTRYVLNDLVYGGKTINPEGASQNGAVTPAETSAYKEESWHPKWGLTTQERDWLEEAVVNDSPIDISISYEEFGDLRAWYNSSSAGEGFYKISKVWRSGSTDQPDSITKSYGTISGAALQDSFETISIVLRSTERQGGSTSDLDPLRTLIDVNARAIHGNSEWDGDSGASRYLSIFDVEPLGQNQQEPESYTDSDTNLKHGYWGNSIEATGQSSVVLFERPRKPLLSLGQLQHANMSRYQFDPTYAVANSYANVRIPMEDMKISDFGGTSDLTYFDLSYMVNDRMWDGFFFSSLDIPYSDTNRAALIASLENTTDPDLMPMLNPRMEFTPSDEFFADRYRKIVIEDPADPDFATAVYRSAVEMWVNGAFNVNSTSVEAWKAVLSSNQDLTFPVYNIDGSNMNVSEDGVVVSRVNRPYNRGYVANDSSTSDEFWKGYRILSEAEIEDLAESIVDEVKSRGPFLSLASFVNRQLVDGEKGKKGALQAALDNPALGSDVSRAVNTITDPNLEGEAVTTFDENDNFLEANLSSTDRSNMGLPGYVLQSDILQQIGSFLTVRSDTFTIRAYGDVVDPFTQEVSGQILCEAVVQRKVDPIEDPAAAGTEMEEFIKPTSQFGRGFEVVSFRWLQEQEI
tara:strand:- start:1724 stop:5425 length:3702 start_codon:yes stop_codon:yes gene_type:complete